MQQLSTIEKYANDLLQIDKFKDYCPNGLQIQGKKDIKKIVCGVSANLEFIQQAISNNADAIFVHHGFFWKSEAPSIVGIKAQKISTLIKADVNLFAYHLPLDAHSTLGNNYLLGKLFNLENITLSDNGLLCRGSFINELTKNEFIDLVAKKLNRHPTIFSKTNKKIKKIAWCTGAGQDFIEDAAKLGVDLYLSGEISERTPHTAYELDIMYCHAGHHATETLGIKALGEHLANKFSLDYQFINIANIV